MSKLLSILVAASLAHQASSAVAGEPHDWAVFSTSGRHYVVISGEPERCLRFDRQAPREQRQVGIAAGCEVGLYVAGQPEIGLTLRGPVADLRPVLDQADRRGLFSPLAPRSNISKE